MLLNETAFFKDVFNFSRENSVSFRFILYKNWISLQNVMRSSLFFVFVCFSKKYAIQQQERMNKKHNFNFKHLDISLFVLYSLFMLLFQQTVALKADVINQQKDKNLFIVYENELHVSVN